MIIIFGIIGGAAIGFFVGNLILKKRMQNQVDEMNAKADLQIQEARLTAKRIVDDAEVNAEKIISKAERENEKKKQQKKQLQDL